MGGGFTLSFAPTDLIKTSSAILWNGCMTSPGVWGPSADWRSSCPEGSVPVVGPCPTDEKCTSLYRTQCFWASIVMFFFYLNDLKDHISWLIGLCFYFEMQIIVWFVFLQYHAGQTISHRVPEARHEVQLSDVKPIPHSPSSEAHSGLSTVGRRARWRSG